MRKFFPLLTFCLLLFSSSFAAVLENEYIKVIVNPGPYDTGRFTLQTTGGDPARTDDDNAELLFGGADPWSSYTTIRIDGTDYVFGGPTQTRAGFDLPSGEHISGPERRGNAIYTIYQIGDIEVTQVLSFARTSTTGLEDALQIQYFLKNKGSAAHSVGVRLLLDTKLGEEDGAPIRLGNRVITTETTLRGNLIPDFWQAFDNLQEPRVIAQGTLRGGSLTPPSEVLIANWGTLADKSWKVSVDPTAGFIRKGEDEPDTAFALFWEGSLAPGETRQYCTQYGLGGVTISRGRLSLGVTSPREVIRREPFKVVAYIENKEQTPVANSWVRLQLPPGFEASQQERNLGEIGGGQARTVEWVVVARETAQSGSSFQVTVGGDNCEPVSVSRKVIIIGPPRIDVSFVLPNITKHNERWFLAEDPTSEIRIFPVKVTVKNTGDSATVVELVCGETEALSLALPYDNYKYIGTLNPQESFDFVWYFAPHGFGGGIGRFQVTARYHGRSQQHTGTFSYPGLKPRLFTAQRKAEVAKNSTFSVEIWAQNVPQLDEYSLVISYPDFVRLVSVWRGTAARPDSFTWKEEGPGRVRISSQAELRDLVKETLAILNFEALAEGAGEIRIIPEAPSALPEIRHGLEVKGENSES